MSSDNRNSGISGGVNTGGAELGGVVSSCEEIAKKFF